MLLLTSFITLLAAFIFGVRYQKFNADPETLNLNFDLLTRSIITLPEDNWNHNVSIESFTEYREIPQYEFLHGVASGDPLKDAVILWTRISPLNLEDPQSLIKLDFKVSRDEEFINVVQKGTVLTNGLIDYTVKVDITNLEPNTTYYYQFQNPKNSSSTSTIGRTRTLPHDNQVDELSLAIYSCANYAGGFYHAYKFPAIQDSVDYVIHLGDYIYEFANGVYTNGTAIGRDHVPENECFTLQDYRTRYGSYRLDQDLQLSHAKFPWIIVWDDHEVADNSWLRGSVQTRGYDFLKRRDEATQAYFEWLPIRPQREITKIWRSFKFGDLFKINMLDTRHYSRDLTDYYDNQELIKNLVEFEDRTMLGYDQEKWLERRLAENDTIWNFIASQCVVRDIDFTLSETGGLGFPFEEFNQDAWDGYIANRNRMLSFIKENDLKNSVIFSGDFHIAIASELSLPGEGYDIETGEGTVVVEFTTSAVSSPTTFPKHFNELESFNMSKELVAENSLLWNDGYWRGYMKATISKDKLVMDYYGADIKEPEVDSSLHLAHFEVKNGQSKIDRGSIEAFRGALNGNLENQVNHIDYSTWSKRRGVPVNPDSGSDDYFNDKN